MVNKVQNLELALASLAAISGVTMTSTSLLGGLHNPSEGPLRRRNVVHRCFHHVHFEFHQNCILWAIYH